MIVRQQYITAFDPVTGGIAFSRSLARYEDPEELASGMAYVLGEAGIDPGSFTMVPGPDGEWSTVARDQAPFVEHVYTKTTLNQMARQLIAHPDAFPEGKQLTVERRGTDEQKQQMHAYIDAVLDVANSSEGLPVSKVHWPDLRDFKPGLLNALQVNTYLPL